MPDRRHALADPLAERDAAPDTWPMSIRIHQSDPSPATIQRLVSRLEQATPRSSKKAHDVVAAAKAYAQAQDAAPSQSGPIQDLQREILDLRDCLRDEKYLSQSNLTPVELLFAYLSDFSDAHPRWRHEYSVLNRFIPKFLSDRRSD